jgi:hypothetical protein
VGIGGFASRDLIQAGTESDYIAGQAQCYAWIEVLPAYATVVPQFTVRPGDRVGVSIVYLGWSR